MSIGAMSLQTISIDSSPDVLGIRDRLEMLRVYAGAITAEVIQCHPVRNRADEEFIRNVVGESISTDEPKATVSLRANRSRPLPAAIFALLNLCHEAI